MADVETLTFAEVDGASLQGDLYRPDGDGPHPVVIAAPGGGWLRGDKKQLGHWGRHLAAQGFAVFIADYRRSVAGKAFPQNVRDVMAAARFIEAKASALGLDPERMGLLGASAGAHLAALCGLARDETLLGGAAVPFKALVTVYGVFDLFAHWQDCLDDAPAPGADLTERMLGCAPFDNPALYAEASPLRQITYARNGLKTLVIWGADDLEVLPSQSLAFARALRQARFFVRTLPTPGAGHFWFSEEPLDAPGSATGRVAPHIVRFLKQHLA